MNSSGSSKKCSKISQRLQVFNHIEAFNPTDLKSIDTPKGRFYVTPEGNKYRSITTMLGMKEKPHLNNWRNMLGEQKATREMKRCSDRGTAVHDMVEKYLKNYPKPTEGHSIEHIKEYNPLRMVLRKNVNNIIAQEVALYSDQLKLAGRVDCIAEWKGQLSIIDFKSSTGIKNAEMIEDYFLQCAAYSLMLDEIYGIVTEQAVIVMSVEKGLVPLVFVEPIDKWIRPLLVRNLEYNRE